MTWQIKRAAIICVALLMLCVALMLLAIAVAIVLWPPVGDAPMLTVEFLGYTNRTRPYALIAITNHSKGSVTLDPQCLMMYGTTLSKTGLLRVTSIEPLNLRMTRLDPGEGFVDEIFAFPGVQAQCRFECYASRTSTWLEFRRSVELWYYKYLRRMQFPPRSRTWHAFEVGPVDCPP